jgi:hypothetical protein
LYSFYIYFVNLSKRDKTVQFWHLFCQFVETGQNCSVLTFFLSKRDKTVQFWHLFLSKRDKTVQFWHFFLSKRDKTVQFRHLFCPAKTSTCRVRNFFLQWTLPVANFVSIFHLRVTTFHNKLEHYSFASLFSVREFFQIKQWANVSVAYSQNINLNY